MLRWPIGLISAGRRTDPPVGGLPSQHKETPKGSLFLFQEFKEQMFTVYVLYSPKYDKIYIGYTSNLVQRLLSHNKLGQKGWTKNFRPWILIHSEEFTTKPEAMKREKQLKSGKGREWIRTFIPISQ